MGRSPCCAKAGLNRGAWSAGEDRVLTNYINIHGEGKWRDLPQRAGLKRCGKSCRLRWLNYLRPDIKRGNISMEEEELIVKLHRLLGNRWSLIAGRLPGRTDNEIKNYWNTNLTKRVQGKKTQGSSTVQLNKVKEKGCTRNLWLESKPGTTAEPHRVIRTKAIRCTKVLIPPQLQNQMVKSPLSSTLQEDDSSDFLMDFNINDLIFDILNSDIYQDKDIDENDNVLGGGNYGSKNMSSASDFAATAYEAMPDDSTDEVMLENWGATYSLPLNEALELNKLPTFLN